MDAHHEAGHAVTAVVLGQPVERTHAVIRSPRRRGLAAWAALRGRALWRSAMMTQLVLQDDDDNKAVPEAFQQQRSDTGYRR